MSAHRLAWLVILPLITPVTGLAAQQTLVTPGARVRISAPTVAESPLLGTVVALPADTLIVDALGYADPLALSLASLARLEVSQGRESRTLNTLKGAGVGSLIGVGAGLATVGILCAINDTDTWDCDFDDPYIGLAFAVYGTLGLAIGALTGAIIGSTKDVDRWVDVPLDRLRFSLTPSEHLLGLTVSARVAF